jgi:hypothetical protein
MAAARACHRRRPGRAGGRRPGTDAWPLMQKSVLWRAGHGAEMRLPPPELEDAQMEERVTCTSGSRRRARPARGGGDPGEPHGFSRRHGRRRGTCGLAGDDARRACGCSSSPSVDAGASLERRSSGDAAGARTEPLVKDKTMKHAGPWRLCGCREPSPWSKSGTEPTQACSWQGCRGRHARVGGARGRAHGLVRNARSHSVPLDATRRLARGRSP